MKLKTPFTIIKRRRLEADRQQIKDQQLQLAELRREVKSLCSFDHKARLAVRLKYQFLDTHYRAVWSGAWHDEGLSFSRIMEPQDTAPELPKKWDFYHPLFIELTSQLEIIVEQMASELFMEDDFRFVVGERYKDVVPEGAKYTGIPLEVANINGVYACKKREYANTGN